MAAGVEVEVEFSGCATTMKHNRTLAARWLANAAADGLQDQGKDPTSGRTDMGKCRWSAGDPSGDRDHRRPHAGAFASSSGTRRPGRWRTRPCCSAATLVAQTAIDLLRDPASSTRRGGSSGPRPGAGRPGYHPGRAPLDERNRTGGALAETSADRGPRARCPAVSTRAERPHEEHIGPSVPRPPGDRPTSPRPTGGTALRDVRRLSTCRPTSDRRAS